MRPLPSVPILPSGGPTPVDVGRLADALASAPSDAVLSHRSAAAVWGLWTPKFDSVELTSPAGARGSRYTTSVQQRAVVAHRRVMDTADVTTHLGLPVTSIGRTWLDLAALLDVHDLVAAGDSALRAGASATDLSEHVSRSRMLRGLARARVAVGLLDARSRSRPESRIRSALILGGLPRPGVNEVIRDEHGGWLAEPDLHYAEAKLALEYNGEEHATLARMRKDSTRLLDLQREEWEVRTYTAVHAFRRLDEVVDDVYRLLLRRAPQLLTHTRLARRVTYLQDRRRRNFRL
jgi:hypothetical protein